MAQPHTLPPDEAFSNYVEHPRFGRGPRITGLNPKPYTNGVHLHWNAVRDEENIATTSEMYLKLSKWGIVSYPIKRIPNTAVPADLQQQTPATYQVTHYFDLARVCCDCKRSFIFFAEEQKYWYEELGFGLDADCIRCIDCRKKEQAIARHRETYEALIHVTDRDVNQNLQLANACLTLVESSIFTTRKLQTIRMLLNSLRKDTDPLTQTRVGELHIRLLTVERELNDRREI